jgi:hypothetical protein
MRNTAAPADALSRVLNAVEDPDARRWLEAMLTRGECAQVDVGDRDKGICRAGATNGAGDTTKPAVCRKSKLKLK